MVKIVADRFLPGVAGAFPDSVELVLCNPADIDNRLLHQCDALLIRSSTRVDERLLDNTSVRFIATATSGFDHVDTDYLAAHGIGFATAAGSNARPVAEYVLSALAVMCEYEGLRLADQTVGIIGCGHIGSQLAVMLNILGVETLLNDPPLAEQGIGRDFVDLDTVLGADVVTLHVPYTAGGRYPTANLIDGSSLKRMKRRSWLINTARGGVVDETALRHTISTRDLRLVLDVWRGEPAIDQGLAEVVRLGTAHIAGYSHNAKLRASAMICRAVCDHFRLGGTAMRPQNGVANIREMPLAGSDFEQQARAAVLKSYDVRDDATAFGQLSQTAAPAASFCALRHHYQLRDEFSSLRLLLSGPAVRMAERFHQLGFEVRTAEDSHSGQVPGLIQ